jgi:hypothetical protein
MCSCCGLLIWDLDCSRSRLPLVLCGLGVRRSAFAARGSPPRPAPARLAAPPLSPGKPGPGPGLCFLPRNSPGWPWSLWNMNMESCLDQQPAGRRGAPSPSGFPPQICTRVCKRPNLPPVPGPSPAPPQSSNYELDRSGCGCGCGRPGGLWVLQVASRRPTQHAARSTAPSGSGKRRRSGVWRQELTCELTRRDGK